MGKSEKAEKRRRVFAKEYALHHDGTKAAIAAGYSAKSAETQQWKLRQEPAVAKMIVEEEALLNSKHEKKVEQVLEFDPLAELAEMAQDWRNSKYGVQMCHVRAAELYLHARNGTPEAKKIMAEIQNRAAGFLPGPQDDFKPEWAKSVN
jgi:hypothetical protein